MTVIESRFATWDMAVNMTNGDQSRTSLSWIILTLATVKNVMIFQWPSTASNGFVYNMSLDIESNAAQCQTERDPLCRISIPFDTVY